HTIIFFPAKGALIPLKEWVGSKKGSEDVDEYKRDPIRYAADNARFLEEAFSTQAITEERRNKLLDKYLSLIIKYDRQAWKPFDEPKNGYPEYLSDGFSNLGSDVEVDSKKRWGREKLNVDKAEIFSQSRDFLRKTIADALDDLEKVKAVASYVYNNIRYGDPFALIPEGQSIVISKYLDEGLGVCRHQAMYTQVLLQTLGVRSMLFPNKLNGGKHLSNLVLIGDTWFLLDVTSPKNKHLPAPKKEAYLVEVGSRVELSPEEISKIRLVVKDGDRVYMSDPRAAYWRIRPR
ncbi:transglutaminase domain-containing protein, partial [Candidatus Woesebacteria bacterium]|nr:transglutaminase domain-containing protein [Candidatus Woesebacteria bacterium]